MGVGSRRGLAGLQPAPARGVALPPRPAAWRGVPFKLGVASGDPSSDGFGCGRGWCRSCSARTAACPDGRVPVDWKRLARRGHEARRTPWHGVGPARAGALGAPRGERAAAGTASSSTSFRYRNRRLRCRPDPHVAVGPEAPRSLSFAFASCQDWSARLLLGLPEHGRGGLDRRDPPRRLRLRVRRAGRRRHSKDGDTGRAARGPPQDLDRWRMQYALYKSDPDLAARPRRGSRGWSRGTTTRWQNDYVGGYDGTISPSPRRGVQGVVRAPARTPPLAAPPRRLARCSTASRTGADSPRSMCSTHGSTAPRRRAAWGEAPACDAGNDPSKGSMLGSAQEKWLIDALSRRRPGGTSSRPRDDGAPRPRRPDRRHLWHDAWDGFPASRQAITDTFTRARVRNPVMVDRRLALHLRQRHPAGLRPADSPVVATEFVGTSITTNGDDEVYGPYYGPMIKWNPHIKFFDGDRRGYVRCKAGLLHLAHGPEDGARR